MMAHRAGPASWPRAACAVTAPSRSRLVLDWGTRMLRTKGRWLPVTWSRVTAGNQWAGRRHRTARACRTLETVVSAVGLRTPSRRIRHRAGVRSRRPETFWTKLGRGRARPQVPRCRRRRLEAGDVLQGTARLQTSPRKSAVDHDSECTMSAVRSFFRQLRSTTQTTAEWKSPS